MTEDLLRAQHGVYAVHQAPALGLRRRSDGTYPGVSVFPGVWSLLGRPIPFEALLMAASLYCGPRSRLHGWVAVRVLGYRGYLTVDPPRIAIPPAKHVRSGPDLFVLRTRFTACEERLGFRMPPAAVMLAECVRFVSFDELSAMIGRALQRRDTTLARIRDFCVAHPRARGAKQLSLAAEQFVSGAESVGELECLAAFSAWGMPSPHCQVEIWEGSTLVAVADFYWDGVAVFRDGAHHLEVSRARRDRRNRTRLESLNLQVVTVVGDPRRQEGLLRRRIEVAWAAARARPRPDAFTAIPRYPAAADSWPLTAPR